MAIIRSGNPKNIAIHHSAVKTTTGDMAELKARAKSYDNYHKDKSIGWNNTTNGEFGYKYIRYHYMIARDGSLLQVQDEKYVLYHSSDGANGEFNYWGIAICFDGNYQEEKPTEEMMRTAVELIREIQTRYDIDPKVRGHKEVAASSAPTSCPGINIGTSQSGWIKQLISNVNNDSYPTTPEPPQPSECEKEVERLTSENKSLVDDLAASRGELEALEKEHASLEEDYDRVLSERNEFEKQYNDAVTELNALKEENTSWIKRLVEALAKIFGSK